MPLPKNDVIDCADLELDSMRVYQQGEKVCVGDRHVWRCINPAVCHLQHPESDKGYLGWTLLDGYPKKKDQ